MILRTYGKNIEGVDVAFDAVAFESMGFRRNRRLSMSVEYFEATYERILGKELTAEAEGEVQLEVERELLRKLEEELMAIDAERREDEVVLIENVRGVDQPRTHERKGVAVVEGENRLHFTWWIDPPLKVGVYRKR